MTNDDPLSQEDIDRMTTALESAGINEPDSDFSTAEEQLVLSRQESETIREISNIFLSAGAAALGLILDEEIDLPTPEVLEYTSPSGFSEPYAEESKMAAFLNFSGGLTYDAVFLFKTGDAKRIAAAVMGDTDILLTDDLSELEMNGVTEAFSQMMNESSASIAAIIAKPVEASVPQIQPYTDIETIFPQLAVEPFVAIHFELKSNQNLPIQMIQLMTGDDARKLVAALNHIEPEKPNPLPKQSEEPALSMSGTSKKENEASGEGGGSFYQKTTRNAGQVTVQPVQFAPFDHQPSVYGEQHKNLDLVMDVSLNLTVELGKTEISIKEILELTRGSVVELERIAGEPVDLLANGKLIAKGEVVVIEDNFGLRITSIVSPADRLRGLT